MAVTGGLRAAVLRPMQRTHLFHRGAQTGALVTPQAHTGATSCLSLISAVVITIHSSRLVPCPR